VNGKLTYGAYTLIALKFFTVFPEYFIGITILYLLIVLTLLTYNVYGLLLQKSISECLALVLFMSCYLIYNDDLICLGMATDVNPYLLGDLPWKNFESFNHSIRNDFLAFFYKFLICFFSAIYFLVISDTLKEQKLIAFEYLLIILLAIVGFMLMCNSNDLLTAYLTIELGSLAAYILASFRKTSSYSVEAGIKYFITGAVSSAFFLFGSSILYGVTGSIQFLNFDEFYLSCDMEEIMLLYKKPLLSSPADTYPMDYPYVVAAVATVIAQLPFSESSLVDSFPEIGLIFILFSIFIKLSVAPFHLWALDVYEGSPTNSTIFFAVISKLSLFVLLTRLCYGSFIEFADCWEFYTLVVGVLSVFVGSFGGLRQRKLKTLIAYSSTSHMGYCLLAFTTNYSGLTALFFYMTVYMISGIGIWSIMLALRLRRRTSLNKYNKELGSLSLLRKTNPSLTFAFALTMFSLAGIPPMVGFLAKMLLFLPIVGLTYYSAALVSIMISVVSTFYYIRVIKVLYFENVLIGELYYPTSGPKVIVLSLSVFSLIFFFLNPMFLYLLNYTAILEFQLYL